jgi:hypothetical protein
VEKLSGQPRDVAVSDLNIVFLVCGSSVCMYREQQGVLVTHPLDFEPTCIATLPQGTQIAVGGKVNFRKNTSETSLSLPVSVGWQNSHIRGRWHGVDGSPYTRTP